MYVAGFADTIPRDQGVLAELQGLRTVAAKAAKVTGTALEVVDSMLEWCPVHTHVRRQRDFPHTCHRRHPPPTVTR
jgi:hypothetical protein